jgi:ketosteroid isomerase-like protein
MKSVNKFVVAAVLAFAALASCTWAQAAPDATAAFIPFEQWKSVVLSGDAAALVALYSTDPAAQVRVGGVMHPADADTSFWLGLKARSMKVEIVRLIVRPERASVIFRADIVSGQADGKTVTVTVTDDQYWLKQGEQWRLVGIERTDSPRLKQPSDMKKNIYPADVDAHVEIKDAEGRAAREHKRLLLIFGANWCFDCHVLDLAFQGPDLAPVVTANYELVHIDLGPDEHKNADLVKQYEIPLDKGVPAIAVAESDGRLVFSQKNGEVEDARRLTPEVLLEFLNKWKPQAR